MIALINHRGEVCPYRMLAMIALAAAFVGWLEVPL